MPIEKQKQKIVPSIQKQQPQEKQQIIKKTKVVSPTTVFLKYLRSWRAAALHSIGNKQKLEKALFKQAKLKNKANYWGKGGIAWFLRNYTSNPNDALLAVSASLEAKDPRLAYALATIVIDQNAPLQLRKKAAEALLKISPTTMASAYEVLRKTIKDDNIVRNHINKLLLKKS